MTYDFRLTTFVLRLTTLFLIFILISKISLLAQVQKNDSVYKFSKGLVIENNFYVGKALKNYPIFPKTNSVMFYELNIAKQTYGNKAWNKDYNFPQLGISFIYGELGNDKVLGQNYSIIPNFVFINNKDSKWHREIKAGMGFAYFNKKYDRLSNPDNLIVGSSITNITYLSYGVLYDINDKLSIRAGATAFHFSNGHYTLPNVGLNVITGNIDIKYYPSSKPKITANANNSNYDDKIHYNIRTGFGIHEFFGFATKPINGPKYPVYLTTIYLSKRYSYKNNVHLGMFVNYYTGFHDYIINKELFENKNTTLKSMVASIFIGHEYIMGRFGIIAQLGFNIYNPFVKEYYKLVNNNDYNAKLKIYNSNKLGFQYYIIKPETKPNLFIGIFIKSNSGQADVVEYSLGFTF